MIVCNLEGLLCDIFSLEVAILKMVSQNEVKGREKLNPNISGLFDPKEAKNAIKSILAKTFNFRHFSDIPHQTIMRK